jgi:hypothetical protein
MVENWRLARIDCPIDVLEAGAIELNGALLLIYWSGSPFQFAKHASIKTRLSALIVLPLI